ncbi:MAG: hypothetical protein C0453_19090 [Comamonadaceae bacterium]|nr:hypothetical protein [Comamonadaceae bacterium]
MTWYVEHLHRDGSVLARVPVQGEVFRIGRALDNDLVLDDLHTAAHHATLHPRADGTAYLRDLGSKNGIAPTKGKRSQELLIANEQPVRVGQQLIRVRSSDWPVPPEIALITDRFGVWSVLALLGVVAYTLWELWLSDVQDKSPPYLYGISGVIGAVALWSTAYAVFGRLISGMDRFTTHLFIACCGYLAAAVASDLLDTLAFAAGWVWPLQITQYVLIGIVALTVRAHLRQADPRHWPTTRWAWGLVTLAVLFVPLTQEWISNRQLTAIQTMDILSYPSLRLAAPTSIADFTQQATVLQQRADLAKEQDADAEVEAVEDE